VSARDRPIIVDHVTLVVRDLEASRRFFTAALAPLGFQCLTPDAPDVDGAIAFGLEDFDDFAIVPAREVAPTTTAHVAFLAPDRDAVDAFYWAALEAGGTPRIGPRVHEAYSPRYYAAFVSDPDGNNIEAVHHGYPAP
jgi:catechol 2,3-dioxygenase-like lactoylglutathione lyase family enzyme